MKKVVISGVIIILASLLWYGALLQSGQLSSSFLNMYGPWALLIVGILCLLAPLKKD